MKEERRTGERNNERKGQLEETVERNKKAMGGRKGKEERKKGRKEINRRGK